VFCGVDIVFLRKSTVLLYISDILQFHFVQYTFIRTYEQNSYLRETKNSFPKDLFLTKLSTEKNQ
jgi:hypothetical protein